jgi:hypothetical protein
LSSNFSKNTTKSLLERLVSTKKTKATASCFASANSKQLLFTVSNKHHVASFRASELAF